MTTAAKRTGYTNDADACQEAVAVALRKMQPISIDDAQKFLNPNLSRTRLDRGLRRHGVGNLRDLKIKTARPKTSS